MLNIQNLNKSFAIEGRFLFGGREKLHALKDVTVEIAEGKSLGIVGESGSGKTTLAKILAGFLTADSGTATFLHHNLLTLSRHERAKLVQMVFQDPFASLNPKLILGTQLDEAIRHSGESRNPRFKLDPGFRRGDELMQDVGLPADFLERYPHQLSGGQRQRFAIARALAMEPPLLIADEPVSSLDISVQGQIINLLNDLRKKRKFTMIVISHDLTVIANLCDRAVVMKSGEIVEDGTVKQVLTKPKADYTKRLLDAVPQV